MSRVKSTSSRVAWRALTSLRWLSRAAVAATLVGTALPQSTPASKPGSAWTPAPITIQNLAPFARREGCSAVVPFARGQVREPIRLVVPGAPTCWQPFGARWPDGSVRQALCLFEIEMPPLGEKTLTLEPGDPLSDKPEIPLPTGGMTVTVVHGDKTESGDLGHPEVLEHNALRCTRRLHTRVGTSGIVAEALITSWRSQEHAQVDLAIFFSDPNSKAMKRDIKVASVECKGMALVLRHAGPLAMDTEFFENGTRTVLLRDNLLADGQGLRRSGAVVPALRGDKSIGDDTVRAATLCPLLAACDWRSSGAYGPFGVVPEPAPGITPAQIRNQLAARHGAFVAQQGRRGEPFLTPEFGNARCAAQTGDQEDFGVAKLGAVAGTGLGSFLLEVELSVLQEGCRPVHFFETDGNPVLASAHPKWIVWTGRTHWHCGVSSDRLGKDCPEPPLETHGWSGKDRQHWSSNNLCGYYLLTGAPWALREIQNEIQLFLAGETIDPTLSTSSSDATRAVGRTLLAAAWIYLCTGDQALLKRANERVDQIIMPSWVARTFPESKVRTFGPGGPDGRVLDGKTQYWTPWQDTLAAVGLEAWYRVSGNANAKELGRALARTMVRHGWKLDAKEVVLATAMRWKDGGEPLTAEELARGERHDLEWSYSTAYSVWALGGLEIARQSALELGDAALAERAAEIQRRVRALREVPRVPWYDRFGEWDAVR